MTLCVFFLFLSLSSLSSSSLLQTLKNGVEAYLFAYPLVDFEATKDYVGTSNTFSHVSTLPDPSMRIIVRPNVDTLYSFAFLDLTSEPLYLMMPDTNDRYYILELMDAWTNVFSSFGKRTTGTKKQEFFITNSSWEGEVPAGLTHVVSPTKNAWIAGRIQVDGDWDVGNVSAIQQKMVLTEYSAQTPRELQISENSTNRTSPDFVVAAMSMEDFFNNFTESMKLNAPAAADAPILESLKTLGIEPGKDWTPGTLSFLERMTLKLAYRIGQDAVKYGMSLETRLSALTNGWIYKTDTIGNYSTDYKTRALIAHIGMAANMPIDAVYCNAYYDGDNDELSGSNNYVLHLSKEDLPPVNAFWSLTMYDEDSYLVPNELGKYAIRDRDSLVVNSDGSLDIYIQNAKPDDAKIPNWLPSPKGKFNLTLRLYWPKQSVFDRTWKPKGLKRV